MCEIEQMLIVNQSLQKNQPKITFSYKHSDRQTEGQESISNYRVA